MKGINIIDVLTLVKVTNHNNDAQFFSPQLWQRMAQKERTFVKPTNKVSVLSATRPDSFIARLK